MHWTVFRLSSLLTVVLYFQFLLLAVKVSHRYKYYAHHMSTLVSETLRPEMTEQYDFIIVGGGTAGLVVANRLSKNNKVLLIEAGGTPFYANSISIITGKLLHMPEIDYTYKTVPQTHAAQGQVEKRVPWPRGKMLGGSSSINFMMYVRGHPLDYENWANITGDDGWTYPNLLPLFKRSINYNGNFPWDKHYGYTNGNQNVETSENITIHQTFMNAGKELGYKVNIDLNRPQQNGFGPVEMSQKRGERECSYTAFLEPILNRKNLVIKKYSQAVKIQMDKSNRAVGIWYEQHGVKKYARASKEIIVSCGTVDTPKLLILSGIGPTNHLKRIKIKPLINLPVGQNLKDHMATLLLPFTINESLSFRPDRDLGISDIFEYYTKGKGPLTQAFSSFAQAFFTSPATMAGSNVHARNWPDLQMIFVNLGPYQGITSDLGDFMNIRKDIFENLFSESVKNGMDGFALMIILGRPKSSGVIQLASKDPSKPPIIDPKYLSRREDVDRFLEAIKFALKLVETKAFQKLNATYANVPIDDCRGHIFKSDQYWECYVRHFSLTMYHPVGTCRMGKPEDKYAVVDSKLRVLQTVGLRVVDASIMPEIISGNTAATTVLIGEKGADMIREHWAKQYLVCLKEEPLYIYDCSNKCFYSRWS